MVLWECGQECQFQKRFMIGLLHPLKKKNGRLAVTQNVIICRGFNRYFFPPKCLKWKRDVRRTAFVLPISSGWEDWFAYRDFFWNVVERIKENTDSVFSIMVGKNKFGSIRDFQMWASMEEDEDIPEQIVFINGTIGICCVLEFENWVDVGHADPYSCSFTFSCYSPEGSVDELIFKSCVSPLVGDCFGEYSLFLESNRYKWQWRAEALWRSFKPWFVSFLIILILLLLMCR